jgi:enoyl-CoA hydratase/carnithine racemase
LVMSAAAYTTLSCETLEQGALRVIALNRPAKLNAMTIEMMQELWEELSAIEVSTSVRVVVLRGSGRSFW